MRGVVYSGAAERTRAPSQQQQEQRLTRSIHTFSPLSPLTTAVSSLSAAEEERPDLASTSLPLAFKIRLCAAGVVLFVFLSL